jgi:hypothetical protein
MVSSANIQATAIDMDKGLKYLTMKTTVREAISQPQLAN